MKLKEILITQQSVEYDDTERIILIKQIISSGKIIRELAKDLFVFRYNNSYALAFKYEPVAYLDLDVVKLRNKSYNMIKMIYVIRQHRNTRNVGLFILGMKHLLDYPIILGINSWGGVLFKDGLTLVNSLIKSKYFDVKKINLKTGKTSVLNKEIGLNDDEMHSSLVFEGHDEPPLIYETDIQNFFIFEWQV